MKWINKYNPELEISNHHYKHLSDEEKKNWIKEKEEDEKTDLSIGDILGGSLIGNDSDKED